MISTQVSTLYIDGYAQSAAHVAMTTTLGAAAGCLGTAAIGFVEKQYIDPGYVYNGVLAGLVSITASCSVVEPWAAVVIGIIGAFAYTAGAIFMDKLEIDDAVNATPVHYFAGFWGLLAPGFFARQENMRRAYDNTSRAGCFYGNGGGQILGNAVLAGVRVRAVKSTRRLLERPLRPRRSSSLPGWCASCSRSSSRAA